jgi:DNA primase
VRSLLAEIPLDSVDSKVRVIDEVVPRFRKIADPVERDLYEKEVCRLLGITVHAFRKRMGGMKLTNRDAQTDQSRELTQCDVIQGTLLALLFNYPDARSEVERVGVEVLFAGDYLEIARRVLDNPACMQGNQTLHLLTDTLETAEQRSLLSRVMVSEGYADTIEWRTVFDQCVRSGEKKKVSSIRDIAARLAVLDTGSDEYALLLKQADSLRTRKSKL